MSHETGTRLRLRKVKDHPVTDLTPLILVDVPGIPRPKGSLRHVGRGRLVEQLEGSADWRTTVAYHAYRDRRPGPTYPYTGPVKVNIELWFTPPVRLTHLRPSTRRSGDIDKHARNILDALQDAAVIKDDSQVVELHIYKSYDTPAGASISVLPVPELAPPDAARRERPAPGGVSNDAQPEDA